QCPQLAQKAGPGQFVKVRCWAEPTNGGGPFLDRPFSIHRTLGDNISLLYRVVGPGTLTMSLAKTGDWAKVSGPLGHGLDDYLPQGQSLYLVAGGIGLAPMRGVLDWLGPTNPSTVFYGERGQLTQLDENWLASWAGQFIATTEDGTGYGQTGLVSTPLIAALKKEKRQIFACGPVPMLAAVTKIAAEFNVTPWVSVEAGMACGFGICLTCSLPLKSGGRFRACQEGPVYNGHNIDWEKVK
ncbi:MAG: hypothetical protein ACRCTY_05010, partial [Candidatus Adiutrix sp.]